MHLAMSSTGACDRAVWSLCSVASERCFTVTVIHLLPLLQQLCVAGSTRLTLPVQAQRCHPMPPLPNSSNTSVERVTIMCDSLFIFYTPLTVVMPYYCPQCKKNFFPLA